MSLTGEMMRAISHDTQPRAESRPSKLLIHDTVTPYKISVLVLIRLYLESKGDYGSSAIEYTQEERRALMLLFMELIKVPDMSFSQLLLRITSTVNQSLLQRFKSWITKLANGASCEYYSFFDRLNEPIRDKMGYELTEFTILNKTSVIGIVVRSKLIAFKMMSLEEVLSSIVSEFPKYCKELVSKDSFSEPEASLHSPRSPKMLVPSRWQSVRRVSQLAVMLEQNPMEAGSPAEVSEELNLLITAYPTLYRVHYVQYLNHMRVKEYAGAKDSLHQYFDKIAEAGDRSSTKDPVDDFNRCSRYASLNLAALYARFGHRELALHSVREAVKLAQETNDKSCLQHALIWLEHFSELSSVHSISPGLGLWELSLTGCLIKTLRYTSVTEQPARIFEELARALSFQTRLVRVPLQSTVKTNSKLSQMTLCASLWSYYGQRSMANLFSQSVLHTDSSDKGLAHCAESECMALCVLSNHSFSQGGYEAAESVLNIAMDHFPQPYAFSDIWSKTRYCQLSDRAFYHRDIGAMSLTCDNLLAVDSTEAHLRRAKLYCMQNHYQKALKIIEEILSLDSLKPSTFVNCELRARVMLELIHTHCEMRGHSLATKYIIECLKLTSDHHLVYQHSLVQMYAAHVQLMSGNAEEGFMIMTKHLASFLINGSCYDKGRAQVVYSKCKIASAKSQSQQMFTQAIAEGLQVLEQALQSFQLAEAFIHVQDCLMYMAILCNMLGDFDRRNSLAYQYKDLELRISLDKEKIYSGVIV